MPATTLPSAAATARPTGRLRRFWDSTVGKKTVMAVTGIAGIGFVVVHMAGNLQMFKPVGAAPAMHDYAVALRKLGALLWAARLGLLACVILHVIAATQLTLRNRAARPVAYARRKAQSSTLGARTMRVGGVLLLAFIVFHIADMTFGVGLAGFTHLDPYNNLRLGFQRWWAVVFYVLATIFLGLHLYHGAWASWRSLGARQPSERPLTRPVAIAIAVIVAVGLAAVPIAAALGAFPEASATVEPEPTISAATQAPAALSGERTMTLDARIPAGPIGQKWDRHKFEMKLVNPANKRKYHVIVVGSGLAGASAAATMSELGYNVSCFCFQDSPRRAHSIAAQGGINAAKNYQNDGDSVYRLFYDTVKGGDFRAREANVHRLAQISVNIIDQCVAQGVPFAREYGGLLANRSFGGAQVSRTFYARGQTGQQLLLGAYQALEKEIGKGGVKMYPRSEMLDVILVKGVARGIVTRDLVTGQVESHVGDAVVLATGGYGNVFFLSTNAKQCNTTAIWRAHRKGALFGNPCYTQIHPTCIPQSGDYQSKLTLMSESLRNDGRVWVPKAHGDKRAPGQIPEGERDYYLERKYPSFGNLSPRDIASRAAKEACDDGRGVGPGGLGVYLDFRDAIKRLGRDKIAERYGNLFDMYQRITDENPYEVPMRIYPAVHYTMGGLWVDYNLQSTIPGLHVLGEANFSDHGANRLGASALMQGLADGYFIIPYTIGHYLASTKLEPVGKDHPDVRATEREVEERTKRLLGINGTRTVQSFHRELGKVMWDKCGMARDAAGLKDALQRIPALREEFWQNVKVPGTGAELNQSLEQAGRVADFFELAELMCIDALHREESCGGHFRTEHQTEDGEALRHDEQFAYVAAWEYGGAGNAPTLHKEPLVFENVHLATRSYK